MSDQVPFRREDVAVRPIVSSLRSLTCCAVVIVLLGTSVAVPHVAGGTRLTPRESFVERGTDGTCEPDFTQPSTSPEAAGDRPSSVAIGDFNGDGLQDLATANLTADNVSIQLGDGTGNFSNAVTSPEAAGDGPKSLAVGDFNGDGRQDLASANTNSDNVTILLGDGTGDFSPAPSSPEVAGDGPFFVVVGDFNGNGRLDLATANLHSDNVTILLGTGTGNFAAAATSPESAGIDPISMAVGDFNRDGRQDLATSNRGSANVTIHLGAGTGNFTPAATSPETVGDAPNSVALGDFNEDGSLDFVTANTASGTVTIQLGDGTGNFTPAATSPESAGNGPFSVAVGDFNSDGRQDLATANANSDNVTLHLGTGTGDFTEAVSSPVAAGDGPDAVSIGDFNGDGRPDLAITNDNSDNVTILLGTCPAVCRSDFTEAVSSPEVIGNGPFSVAVGDFNEDGRSDLATANVDSDDVTILLGDGFGDFQFASTSPVAVGSNPLAVVVGDFNGDGSQDLATANLLSNDVTILLGNGTGEFLPAFFSPEVAGLLPNSLAVGDFNGDGRLDLATTNLSSETVTILIGVGNGNFVAAPTSPEDVGTSPVSVTAGDFNRDGRQDLVTANSGSASVTILLGDGTGNFVSAATSPESTGVTPKSVAVGDFNRDAKQDLAIPNLSADTVTILLGDGSGNFTEAATSPTEVGAGPQAVAVGDFNVDGREDLAIANDFSGDVTVLLGDGFGNFTAAPTSSEEVGLGPVSIAVGDFNMDGRQDLATSNLDSNDVTILLGGCIETCVVKIECPANITVMSTTSTGCMFTSALTYPAPVATDNCGLASTVCVPPSGSTFNEGTTTVVCTATDTSGNTAACSFTVTVGAAFGFCAVDDATGDRFQMVVNPTSPAYGVWRYTLADGSESYCGRANSINYFPGIRLLASDNDYSAENTQFFMSAAFKGNSGTVTVKNRRGNINLTLRDRDLSNSVCP